MPAPTTYLPGDIIDNKYLLEREIGRGGMGHVFIARHVHLGAPVALKVLRAGLQNTEILERFRREARAAARIHNPHVVRVFDFGEHEPGAPYLVMEYLEGEDLEALVASKGPLPVAEAVSYVIEACAGLAEVHIQGVIHRDIKPANLFLSKRPDGSRLLKVLDFGISKAPALDPSLTKQDAILGSPRYMSPEQLQSREVDAGVDVWALGITLYELLGGQSPFASGTMPETCAAILEEEPASLALRRPDLPIGLEDVIRRCLAKHRRDRFDTVAELAVALRPFGKAGVVDVSIERAVGTQRQVSAERDPVDEIDHGIERLGGHRAILQVAMSFRELELGGHDVDHRIGFVLSCIDGKLSVEDLIDISGMKPLETVRCLCGLLDGGVITTRLPR